MRFTPIILAFLLLPLVLAGGPLLKASLLNQYPPEAPAGSIVTLTILIENLGTETAEAAAYKLILPRGAVQLTPREEWVSSTSLDAASKASRGIILTYTIRLPPSTPSGTIYATLITRSGNTTRTLAKIPLRIRNPSSINLERLTLQPSSIPPGGEGIVTITLTNTGADTYHAIPVRVHSTSLAYPEGDARLITLPPGETKSISIPIRVLPTAQPGFATLTITTLNQSWQGLLIINDTPAYTISIERVEDTNSERKVTLSIANTGRMSLRNVLITTPNATPSTSAIGKLEEDDYDTTTLTLPPSTTLLTGSVTYTDAYGTWHEDPFTLTLPPREAKNTPSTTRILIILFIITLLLFFLFKRRKTPRRITPLHA